MSGEMKRFGDYLRRLRRTRRLSQDELATRAGLCVDTIRRVEAGATSPCLDTLRKLCAGLDLTVSLLFEGYETGERNRVAELEALVRGCSDKQLELIARVARALIEEIPLGGSAES